MRSSRGSPPVVFTVILTAVALGCFAAPAVDTAAAQFSFPPVIVAGPDGALWYTDPSVGTEPQGWIGRITTAGKITRFTIPTDRTDYNDDSRPNGLAVGPDGALWFTEFGSQIGRITTAGAISEFEIPTEFFNLPPMRIAAGPDGALWFTEMIGIIRRITTAASFTMFAVPTGRRRSSSRPVSLPFGIVAGSDGALWFTTQDGERGKIGRITTAGAITWFDLPDRGSLPYEIVAGSDGALWFTMQSGKRGKIGRITTAGAVSETTVSTGSGAPCGIAEGPDGALWFTEHGANKIGRLTTGGLITKTTLPTARSGPCAIVAGPDGALWFTEQSGKIGRITVDGSITEFSTPVISSYRLTHKVFVVTHRPAASATGARNRHKEGTRFDYRLSETAKVNIVIAQRRPGRRKDGRCVAPTENLAKAKRCVRLFERGSLTPTSRRGVNRVAFSGRIGSQALAPGRYQATLIATNAETNTAKASTTFTIVTR